jgi:hypothetical protein
MLQELLNRSDYLWGILANGGSLRILRDSSTLVGPSYVEFDLAVIFDGDLLSDFVTLYLLCHQSRFEPIDPDLGSESCWLERWRGHAVEAGTRALGALRIGVHDAIEALGTGLVSHPANSELRDDLESGRLGLDDFRRGLLRLVYRILFCFVAEDRDLLLDPEAKPDVQDRYHRWFSTSRLRRLAIRRTGDGHGDLWQALKLVFQGLGNEDGCAALGLTALGGIFETGLSDLDTELALSNRSLLTALRHLCVTRPVPGGPRRRVDYRHLGAEELGGIYESLLEYVPHYDRATRAFALESLAGNERKTTGAYYTPTSLTECLLDTALDPLLDSAEQESEPEAALLSLTVCDPACGSGHFLVAAGRRIAARVAAVRAQGAEPTIDELHEAMHDVVARCLYGVDVNPLAAELAKVSLWLEGMQPGRPLSLLDGHVKVGNALLGTMPALLAGGIPDEAFEPIEGDDRRTATALKRRNRAERSGQGRFVDSAAITFADSGLAKEAAAIDTFVPRNLADIHTATQRLRQLDTSPQARQARLIADAWCSAFVLPKTPGTHELTQSTLDAIYDGSVSPNLIELIESVTARYKWFHWHIEFPQIFSATSSGIDPVTGWDGGFDLVVGNPPWDQLQLDAQEFFASRIPAIAAEPNHARREQAIAHLEHEQPSIYRQYLLAKQQIDGTKHFVHASGRFPLTEFGRLNSYSLFAEHFRRVVSSEGRAALIVPTGIATDSFNQYFFKDLVTSKTLVSLYDFENSAPLFEGVHRSFKFCLLTLAGKDVIADTVDFAFFAHDPDDLKRQGVRFSLSPEEITLLNPNTGTCPVFRTRQDADIALAIYRRHQILVRKDTPNGNPWGVSFQLMFMMNTDSNRFHSHQELNQEGWKLVGNEFRRGSETMLPLYQGIMTSFYDHRAADVVKSAKAIQRQNQPQYLTDSDKSDARRLAIPISWVDEAEVQERLAKRWKNPWFLGFSNVTSPTNERSLNVSLIPRSAVGNSFQLIFADHPFHLLMSALSCIPVDYVIRQKLGGTNMNFFYLEQLPVPPPDTFTHGCQWDMESTIGDWIKPRVLELVYTAWDMASAAKTLDDEGPPFVWNAERRQLLRAELDGAFFHLYGVSRNDTEHILSTFPIANRKDPELVVRVLDVYDGIAIAADTQRPFSSRLEPPPGYGPRHLENP